jgi:acyl-CoA thioester hydrolase
MMTASNPYLSFSGVPEKMPRSQVRARFPDCDPFNHLNNSRYLDYIINAREDQLLHHYGFDVHRVAKETGVTWVIAQHQIAYLQPVAVMEMMTISTRLISFTDRVLQLEAVVFDEQKSRVKALLWTSYAHFNLRTGKSQPHEESLQQFFASIHAPLTEAVSFEERAGSFKQSNLR